MAKTHPIVALFISILLTLSSMTPISAQESPPPQQVLERLFEAPEIDPAWFAPGFLSQVSADHVAAIVAQLEQRYGAIQSITGERRRFTIELERAEVPTQLALDAQGRIALLLFEAPVAAGDLSRQVEAIAALPGETSVLVLSSGKVEAEHNADAALAVGSAAKLAILKAVADAVAAGRLSWDQVVTLKDEWRSLPSGILQDWPADSPITIASLANLMISISDNTATDALIRIVGREAVEAITPRNTPLLTTRELFVLKANEDLRTAWENGDEAARRQILERIASEPLPDAGELTTRPTIGVEWFFSARELCALIEDVAEVPAIGINPGLAERDQWEKTGYKGGSEPGVLNFTTWLRDSNGGTHCVAATWNNAESGLNEQQLVSNYRAILRALRSE